MVVSPLISLMMDQRQKIAPRGLSVEFVREAQTDDNAIRRVIDSLCILAQKVCWKIGVSRLCSRSQFIRTKWLPL